jgi:hypothetical protein
MKLNKLAIIAVGVVSAASAQAAWYTNEAAFVAATTGPMYIEDFSNFTFGNPLNGSQTTWTAPGGNGYGFDAGAPGGLYSNISALSTNLANDPLTLTFTGSPVTAFGGRVANSDISGNIIPGTITLLMSNGDTQSVTMTSTETFIGWVGPTSVASVSMTAAGTTNNWVQLDHAMLGAGAVPEPASMTALGLGVLAMLRRKRSK